MYISKRVMVLLDSHMVVPNGMYHLLYLQLNFNKLKSPLRNRKFDYGRGK